MCDKSSYREQGYEPRQTDELWDNSPMNPKNRKKTTIKQVEREYTGIEFLNDVIR